MRAETDWREAARGIPVWEGAAMLWRELASEWEPNPRWRSARSEGFGNYGWVAYGDNSLVPQDRAIPDLADPDTRAAYDRRLALALGCPEEHANVGVRFRHEGNFGGHAWTIDAGARPHRYDSEWERTARIATADPLLARALAWPKDKRVGA